MISLFEFHDVDRLNIMLIMRTTRGALNAAQLIFLGDYSARLWGTSLPVFIQAICSLLPGCAVEIPHYLHMYITL